jgi:hypothetical protein
MMRAVRPLHVCPCAGRLPPLTVSGRLDHRWDGHLKGVELCGDCWRRGIGSAPDRASLHSSVEALISQWRERADSYLAARSNRLTQTARDEDSLLAVQLEQCSDDLEALLRSSVREGHEEESCAPADGIPSGSDRISAQATETLRTLTERAAWYRDGCDGLEDRDGYYASGDCARDAASDLETALSEIRVLESVIARLRSNHV